FIVNPEAGNGKAKRIYDKLQKTVYFQSVQSITHITDYEGHAGEIAKELATLSKTITCVIVIGGDGTFHEVVNGLSGSRIPLSFIPGGSGNDFARSVEIKGTPEEILEKTVRGDDTLPYWTG